MSIVLSDAQPVQFWELAEQNMWVTDFELESANTFNQKSEPGIDKRYYCQQFNYSDTIRIHYSGNKKLRLCVLLDDLQTVVLLKEFTEFVSGYWQATVNVESELGPGTSQLKIQLVIAQTLENENFNDVIDPWYNIDPGSGVAWTEDVGLAKVTCAFGSGHSQYCTQDVIIPPGNYNVQMIFDTYCLFGTTNVLCWMEDDEAIPNTAYFFENGSTPEENPASIVAEAFANGTHSITRTLVTTKPYTHIKFYIANGGGGGNGQVTALYIFSALRGDYTFLVPLYTSEVILCKEDCGNEYKLIQYTNENRFADLDYTGGQIYAIRPNAKFFEEKFPETDESDTISDETIVKLSGSVKSQKNFQLEPAPSYMIKKMKLILQHNTIKIDGEYWEKEEALESKLMGPRSPLYLANVFLTKRDSNYVTNVYGTTDLIP